MRNQCSCGNVFEYSEKTIGSLIVCQNCKQEVLLKDDSNPATPKLEGKQRLKRFFRWSLCYALFLLFVFLYLNHKSDQEERDSILKATKAFQSTMGDTLGEQAKKILNQAQGRYPKSTGVWNLVPAEESWEWYVTYTLRSADGYTLQEAVFQVIPSTPIEVFPINELAIAIQGDIEAKRQFIEHYEKELKIPQIDLRPQATQFKEAQARMEQSPFFQKLRERHKKEEQEKERDKERE